MPDHLTHELAEVTAAILRQSGALQAAVHPVLRGQIASVVREMNSYYSNWIEGQLTSPADIEVAKANRPPEDIDAGNRQRLGLAHLETEEWMREKLRADPSVNVYSPEFIYSIHAQFYERLPETERVIRNKEGVVTHPLVVGAARVTEVKVGNHEPPASVSLDKFLARFGSFYGGREIIATRRLIAVAAAHHRLAWIHPFGDGNGRVTRLFSHAAFIRAEVDAEGLWTISRGLARKRKDYYYHLSMADQGRSGDLDGRGNLSDRALADFCQFFLTESLDQIQFMTRLLDLDSFEARILDHAKDNKVFSGAHQSRGLLLLREILRRGEISRPLAAEIIDRGGATTRKIIASAEDAGLVCAENQKAPFRLKFSADLHEVYFPRLFLADL